MTRDGGSGILYQSVMQSLPKNVPLNTHLIDALRRYSTTAYPLDRLSDQAVALYNGGAAGWINTVDGSSGEAMFNLFEIFQHHENERAAIAKRLVKMAAMAGTSSNREIAKSMSTACSNHVVEVDSYSKRHSPAITTPGDFDATQAPKARTYLLVTKGVMSSALTLANAGISEGKFNVLLGTNVMEFEKIKMVDDPDTLHTILRVFQETIFAIGKNGGAACWKPWRDQIFELLTASLDPAMVHELAFESLSIMDRQQMDALTFMDKKWTTFFTTFMTKYRENVKPSSSYPRGSAKDEDDGDVYTPPGAGKEHVKFGPVTKQGEWCGEMRTRNGAIAFCNKWNEGKDCNRGVFSGRNKGKCAYTHKCRYCMSPSHRMVDKHPAGHPEAGKWVCPKHP